MCAERENGAELQMRTKLTVETFHQKLNKYNEKVFLHDCCTLVCRNTPEFTVKLDSSFSVSVSPYVHLSSPKSMLVAKCSNTFVKSLCSIDWSYELGTRKKVVFFSLSLSSKLLRSSLLLRTHACTRVANIIF